MCKDANAELVLLKHPLPECARHLAAVLAFILRPSVPIDQETFLFLHVCSTTYKIVNLLRIKKLDILFVLSHFLEMSCYSNVIGWPSNIKSNPLSVITHVYMDHIPTWATCPYGLHGNMDHISTWTILPRGQRGRIHHMLTWNKCPHGFDAHMNHMPTCACIDHMTTRTT